MLKKSLIIISIFLYLSILVTGSTFKVDISYNGNHPFFSLDNVNQFVYAQNGNDESSDSGNDESSDSGNDESSDSGNDESEFASNDENKENSEKNSPDFLSSPEGGTTVDLPVGEDNPPPVGEDNPPPPVGEDKPPPPVGEDNPPPVGEDNPEPSKEENNIKDKINL